MEGIMFRHVGSMIVVWTAVLALAPAISSAQEGNPPASSADDTPQQALESFLRGIRVVTSVATLADKRKEWAADREIQRTFEAVTEHVQSNPSLQGDYYKFQANKRLLKRAISSGKTQLRRMLRPTGYGSGTDGRRQLF
jgi:hypothetical protein